MKCKLQSDKVSFENIVNGVLYVPMLIAIHNTGHHRVGICARANGQKEDEEERLEIEEGGLFKAEVSCLGRLSVRDQI